MNEQFFLLSASSKYCITSKKALLVKGFEYAMAESWGFEPQIGLCPILA